MTEQLSGPPTDHIERGELLRLSRMTPEELHHWVNRGLLPKPSRRYFMGTAGSRSYYPAWALERAKYIKRLRRLGVSGHKVRKILRGEKVNL